MRSARQGHRTSTPLVKQSSKFMFGTVLDGAIVVGIALALGLGFGLSASARDRWLAFLGYGWIPVSLWAISAAAAIRYKPGLLVRRWRWWAVGAGLVAISVGTLSFFKAEAGVLAEASLGGDWGRAVGGSPLGLGVLKLAAIAVITPLSVAPGRFSRFYIRTLQGVGVGLRGLLSSVYGAGYFTARRLRLALNPRYRRRWLRRLRSKPTWRLSAKIVKGIKASSVALFTSVRRLNLSSREESKKEGGLKPHREQNGRLIKSPLQIPHSRNDSGYAPPPPQVTVGSDLAGQPDSKTREGKREQGQKPHRTSKWVLPSLALLSVAEAVAPPQAQLQQMARQIETALDDHGVTVQVKDIKAGPRVVRFGLVPGWVSRKGESGKAGASDATAERTRVKVQSILIREKDIALTLKTPYLRLEAPVPGEALVGLEVPNPVPSPVHLRAVMDSPVFRKIASKGGLAVALGQDTGGSSVAMDLTVLPHFLIAGATGSGKSVCINSIVASLLLTKPPDELRMLMVDPKRVELTPFNGIPHLIAPVIVEVDQVNAALRALIGEMLLRYRMMEEEGVRNIAAYNGKTKEPFPYLVLIVDELADLLMVGGFEVEQNLVRLTQLGRATGMHMVLATQRPSVNVVTGRLKANIPARVAFAVASQVDSRVILDTIGAEKLLGKGDMLLLTHESPKPRRVQGTLVLDKEIDQLVEFWTNQKGPPLPAIPIDDPEREDKEGEVDDNLMEQAREMAVKTPRLSSSFLQRRLRIGAQRALEIVDLLEDEGLIIRE